MFAFCPHCGQKQRAGNAWFYHPVSIIVLALFVIGPFALPLVSRSTQMDRTVKTVLTVLILAYTVLTVYYLYQIVLYEIGVFSELGDIMAR